MSVIAKMESETRGGSWAGTIKTDSIKTSGLNMLSSYSAPSRQAGRQFSCARQPQCGCSMYSASKLPIQIKRWSSELHEMYAKCSYFSISGLLSLLHLF